MVETKATPVEKHSAAIIDSLTNIPIFDRLNATELSVVIKHMNLFDVDPGEYVFKEGDEGDYVCFVANGSLEVLKRSEKGDAVVIATLNSGRSIGEMSVVDHFPRSATVRARKKATLVTLKRREFDSLLEKHPTIGIKILKGISLLLSQNLRKTSSRLVDYMLPIT
ncbi:MAG: cyclic nucleotide-binding domain-containing protein [Desulfobacterales bacterium]|nr:cyclic nucleotide-binding domain-containing protein [Desulfobacterales bacterium]